MKKFKFDQNIIRNVTKSMILPATLGDGKYPDVAVIFKLPKKDKGFYYSGSISFSLLEKLLTNPNYKVGIIDKLYLLNCPDPMLSEGLRKLQGPAEINYSTVRTHPQYCVDGFSICDCTTTGKEMFSSDSKVVRVLINSPYTHMPFVPFPRCLHSDETTYKDPLSGNYHAEMRDDLVYFISDSNTIQIYYPKKEALPDNINSKVTGTINEEDSWINKLVTYRLSLKDLENVCKLTDRITDTDLIKDFLYKQDSFNVFNFLELMCELVTEMYWARK